MSKKSSFFRDFTTKNAMVRESGAGQGSADRLKSLALMQCNTSSSIVVIGLLIFEIERFQILVELGIQKSHIRTQNFEIALSQKCVGRLRKHFSTLQYLKVLQSDRRRDDILSCVFSYGDFKIKIFEKCPKNHGFFMIFSQKTQCCGKEAHVRRAPFAHKVSNNAV